MMSALGVASLLADKFSGLLNRLDAHIYSSDYEELYKLIFEMFYQAISRKPLLERDLYRDVRLLEVLRSMESFLELVNEVVEKYKAVIHEVARETLRRVFAELPKGSSRYVIVCDGLSIIDVTYIALRLRREHLQHSTRILINPGGVTETYKFILAPHDYMQNPNLTLNDIASKIAERVQARQWFVFRGYDDSIHKLRNVHASDVVSAMFNLTSKLYSEILWLRREFKGIVMVFSDHGYDVAEKSGGLYDVEHSWKPNSLSVIAPILVVGGG